MLYVLKHNFSSTCKFGYQTYKTKIWISLRQKFNSIHIILKSCLRNTISILHISLDIKHPNI